jgi:DNA-binding response OmpR family regulator
LSGTIAIVEDEMDIIELVSLHLKKERYTVRPFLDGSSFLRSLEGEPVSLVLLDLMLPDIGGFEICKHLRLKAGYAAIPIIMLTARSDETDKVLGLELGADDYVVKPFSPRELVARVKAVIRRSNKVDSDSERTEIGSLLIDPQRFEATVNGERVDLTTTEFRILQLLASKMGWVFSRDKILTHLWGNDKMVLDRTVDVHIKHLREKLGDAGGLIQNMRGVGYKIETHRDR